MIVLGEEVKSPSDSYFSVFKIIISGIGQQGCLCNVPNTLTPRYRVFTNNKTYACPVGFLIPDIKYHPSIEGLSVELLTNDVIASNAVRKMKMLSIFQDYHDRAVVTNSGEIFKDGALQALELIKTKKDEAMALFLSVPWHTIKRLA